MADATPLPLFSWIEFGLFIGITSKGFFGLLVLEFLVGLFVFLRTKSLLSGERESEAEGSQPQKPNQVEKGTVILPVLVTNIFRSH